MVCSDIPSSFESQSQFINIEAKDTFAAESIAHDQLPEQTASSNAFGGVSQESFMQMQPSQTQQTSMTAAPVSAAPTASGAVATSPVAAPAEPTKDLESASPTKSQPVRKISRFLVSPAILTVTNEKSAQNICIEDPIKSPLPVTSSNNNNNINNNSSTIAQSPNFVQNVTNMVPDKPNDPPNQVNFI